MSVIELKLHRVASLFLLVTSLQLFGCSSIRSCELDPLVVDKVSQIRALDFLEPVPCRKYKKYQVRAFLRDSLEQSNQANELEIEEHLLKLLGFISEDFDYYKELVRLYSEHAAGFYSPRLKQYITVVGLYPQQEKFTQIHELTHALQDQHYQLESFLTSKLPADEHYARLALVEGDATAVLEKYRETLDCEAILANPIGEKLKSKRYWLGEKALPLYLQMSFDFPYFFGLRYYCYILSNYGQQEIDRLFVDPPRTSAEVMRLERLPYQEFSLEIERFTDIYPRANFAGTLQSGRFGQVAIFALLAHVLKIEAAYELSNAYVADSYSLIEGIISPNGVLLWQIVFKDEAAAAVLKKAFELYFSGQLEERIVNAEVNEYFNRNRRIILTKNDSSLMLVAILDPS